MNTIYPKQMSSSTSSSSSSGVSLDNYFIPLQEIILATQNFSDEMWIGDGGYGVVYKGQLSAQWKNRVCAFKRLNENSNLGMIEFRKELEMTISFNHENVDSVIGYCDEDNEMIIVYEYAVNRSLDYHLQDPYKMSCMTWEQRLKICIDAAKGLQYLHSGLGEHKTVIHRNMKSANIVFDKNMKALICGFDLSLIGTRYQPHSRVYTSAAGTKFYLDPVYIESGILTTETDVYSFGVVMFEVLSGSMASIERKIGEDNPGPLMNLVRRYFDEGLEKLIDVHIRNQIDSRSFHTFKELACQCLSFNLKERPTMGMIITKLNKALEFQNQGAVSTVSMGSHNRHQTPMSFSEVNLRNFLIPLDEIKRATKNFSSPIGDGGFGKVFKGKLSECWGNRTVAVKCLASDSKQGHNEFHNELTIISGFNHEHIIPFIGYCDEENEMIIVYEYAVNGSLDRLLANPDKMRCLTWSQRLKIGIGAATGLQYLHSGLGEQKRVIHRDIKSANVLLDENMEAKICDFGLSKSGYRNQPHTQVYTKAAGTHFYLDPIYQECGILVKESDVYSYGVVLFELLSGLLAFRRRDLGDGLQFLMNLVRRFSNNNPEKLIDPFIRDQIDPRSFHTFKAIAYECISFNLKERPTMDKIIEKLKEAFAYSSKYTNLLYLQVRMLNIQRIKKLIGLIN